MYDMNIDYMDIYDENKNWLMAQTLLATTL